jgi:hypothetical protein
MLSFRTLLIPVIIWTSSAASDAASLTLKPSPSHSRLTHDFPCRLGKQTTAEPTARWRAHLSRRSAVYVVQHLEKACRILADRRDSDSQLVPETNVILLEIYNSALRPIYHSYPDLETTGVPEWRPMEIFHAKPNDIRHSTALHLIKELRQPKLNISQLGTKSADRAADRSEAQKTLLPFLDAVAELSFAEKIAYDAYPNLFMKLLDNIPQQPRTDESDAGFRKLAPPLGSVRLSKAALALVKSFMRQAHHNSPKNDQIASIMWVLGSGSKKPTDAAWIEEGPHWELGAYERTQVPPDVIDKVGGMDIVFGAEDPSWLKGKIVDIKDKRLFVHD